MPHVPAARPRRRRGLPRTLRRLARAWARAYREDAEFWRYGPALGPTPPMFPINTDRRRPEA